MCTTVKGGDLMVILTQKWWILELNVAILDFEWVKFLVPYLVLNGHLCMTFLDHTKLAANNKSKYLMTKF